MVQFRAVPSYSRDLKVGVTSYNFFIGLVSIDSGVALAKISTPFKVAYKRFYKLYIVLSHFVYVAVSHNAYKPVMEYPPIRFFLVWEKVS